MTPKALVVGAGISGLTAGRAFSRAGLDVKILEQAPSLEALGAGISLWPNATRILPLLGADDALLAAGAPTAGGIRRPDGRMLASTDPEMIASRYGTPLLLLHRATLQQALLGGGLEEFVDVATEIVRVGEEGDQVFAETRAGETLYGDLLIGVDGLESTVRSDLWGYDPLRHSGLLAYRAVVDWSGDDLKAGEYWGAGGAFGLAPIDGGRIYWYATRSTNGREPPEDNPIPSLIEPFRDWAPELAALVAATPPSAVLRHDLYDRKPGGPWTNGRIALPGDAGHPMRPFLGQGACQAIEDAQAIAEALAGEPDIPAALKFYERRRRKRASRAVRLSHRLAKLIHLRSTILRALRDRAISMTSERARLRQLDSVVVP